MAHVPHGVFRTLANRIYTTGFLQDASLRHRNNNLKFLPHLLNLILQQLNDKFPDSNTCHL
jgi:hypothetical protein